MSGWTDALIVLAMFIVLEYLGELITRAFL